MELYLLRHGVAEKHAMGTRSDRKRRLTGAGRKKMRLIAKGMARLGLTFDLVLSSPLVRTRQTAEIVARECADPEQIELSEDLAIGGDAAALVASVAERRGVERVLLVGHEPYLSGLISVLLAGGKGAAVTMKKGGLCRLHVTSLRYEQSAQLEWLLTPRQLSLLGT